MKFFSEEEVKICQEQCDFENERREPFRGMGRTKHVTKTMNVHGNNVEVDEHIVPVVLWLNKLAGLETKFSCQGEMCSEEKTTTPHVIFTCSNQDNIKYLARLAYRFIKQKSLTTSLNCSVFNIEINIDWYDGDLRYEIRWTDRIALLDFIEWFPDEKLFVSPEI